MLYGKAVLWIRGILYGAGSVHWITDAALDPDPSLFGSRIQDAKFFCEFLTVGTTFHVI